MKILGIFLMIVFICLIIILVYAYLFDICKNFYFFHQSKIIAFLMISFGLFIIFNIVFNSAMSMLISPGNTRKF